MNPIGIVQNEIHQKMDEGWGNIRSKIKLEEPYWDGLTGLADFSHAIILTYLHEAEFNSQIHLKRRPRGLAELPLLGIFAQRNKDRPNPIGITAVNILSVSDDCLEVTGLDAVDGTPVLDIKPYFPVYDLMEKAVVPDWVGRIMENYF